ncbi:MDR family MFS transporter [Limnovirga soli]|uniref:MFS transporter n=1 Tax=Limnovirga soli TaxID=2656915 RepID=A0A8J8JSK9_9BACT|nr:MFS transporter [Limnovirga soli]NNV54185.1 MFS transporter [Limnovirga soli]
MLQATIQQYKNAYSGLTPKTWYLSLVMLINRSGTMVVPFMTIYCTQSLGFSITQAGIIMGLFGLGAIVGAYAGGIITDKFGFYPLQVGALLSGGAMFIITGYLQSFYSLAIGTFILSLCNESFRPANATAIAYYCNLSNRTRSYSLNRLAINLGWAVGGAIGGFLASINYHLLFWVDGCTNIAAALLLVRLLPYVKSGSKHSTQKHNMVKQSAYKDKIYLAFIALTVLFAACFFQLFTILPVMYKTQWHLSEQFIGLLMALNGLIIVAIEMVLVFTLEGKKPLTTYIRTGVLLIGAGYALLNIFPISGWAAIACISIMTIGEILSMPFMNSFWIKRTTESNRGQYAAMYTIAWSIAQITGPTGGSFIADKYSFTTLCWVLAVICLITSAGFFLLGTQINRNENKIAA